GNPWTKENGDSAQVLLQVLIFQPFEFLAGVAFGNVQPAAVLRRGPELQPPQVLARLRGRKRRTDHGLARPGRTSGRSFRGCLTASGSCFMGGLPQRRRALGQRQVGRPSGRRRRGRRSWLACRRDGGSGSSTCPDAGTLG